MNDSSTRRDRPHALTRRSFLGSAVATCALGATRGTVEKDEVLIVGGGLAGLRVLDLLQRSGREARLFEGAERVGGRMHTAREGLPSGVTAEYGAERVPDGCTRLIALVRELGLTVQDYPVLPGALSLRMDGETHVLRSLEDLPRTLRDSLAAHERDVWPFELHQHYCPADSAVEESDPRTGLEWMKSRGLSETGSRFVRAFCAVPVAKMSAFDFWSSTRREIQAGTSRTLAGGVDRITTALAARHPDRVMTGVDIVTVVRDAAGVEVVAHDGRRWRGTHVVLALPLSPLRRLKFEPKRPPLIDAWLKGRDVAHEVRVHVDYAEAELRRQGLSPYLLGVDFPRVLWVQPGEFAKGRRLLSAVALYDEVDDVRAALARGGDHLRTLLSSRLPQLKSLGSHVLCKDISADPRIGGTFPYQQQGAPAFPRSIRSGPIVIAGGDFSSWPGSMEGAVASADAAFAALRG